MGGTATFDDLLMEGKAKFEGERKGLDAIRRAMTTFTPDFEMMSGTKAKRLKTPPKKKPLEVHEPANTAGG